MKLPNPLNEWPIWQNLEQRGILENHREVTIAGGCLAKCAKGIGYDAWDMARPDWLLDLKNGYLESARVLYDPNLADPLNEKYEPFLPTTSGPPPVLLALARIASRSP